MKAKEIARLKNSDRAILTANGLPPQVLESPLLMSVTSVKDWPKRQMSEEELALTKQILGRCELVLRRCWDGGLTSEYDRVETDKLEREIEMLQGMLEGGAAG